MNDRIWREFFIDLNKMKDPDIPNWQNLNHKEYEEYKKQYKKDNLKTQDRNI